MKNLEEMNFAELKEHAKTLGIEVPASVKSKVGVIELITTTWGANQSAPKAQNTDAKYSDLSLEDLQDLALEKGFALTGNETREKLIEMFTGETQKEVKPITTAESVGAVLPKVPTPKIETADTAEGNEILPWVIMDKAFYKEHFETYEKVRVIIPLGLGESRVMKDADGRTVYPYETVSINGYAISIRKGVYVSVPKPFAEIIEQYTNFQVESDFDISLASDDKIEALS